MHEIDSAIQHHSSRLSGFHHLSLAERRSAVAQWAGLTGAEVALLDGGLATGRADAMIENAIGGFALPLGIATNFVVNGRDALVPMVVEEPSVIAAASHGALLARALGGFAATADAGLMIGQLHVVDVPADDLDRAAGRIESAREQVLAQANSQSESLPRLGGGAKGLEVRRLPNTRIGPALVVHILFDTVDAMGANAVNTAAEAAAPLIEELTGGHVLLRILSNLADRRVTRVRCRVPARALARDDLDGGIVAQRIVAANALALADPYRAATHNKGIMNGIGAVVVATGNDWRAVEAGAHAYAARDGTYRALTDWRLDEAGNLVGTLELPLALGTVGGLTRAHPLAAVVLKILAVDTARALAEIVASVGLAQNLSALRALVSEGIQPGHMALHARQIAMAAGASAEQAVRIAAQLVSEGRIHTARARELVREMEAELEGR